MHKHKPTTASKRMRGPKIAARAQRTKQAIVKSPIEEPLHSIAPGSIDSLPKIRGDCEETSTVENRADTSQNDDSQMTSVSDSKEKETKNGFDLFPAVTNVQAYQAKLLEITQANVRFAFEFGYRLMSVRSHADFLSVIAELTNKRLDMFQKFSKEMTELSTKRLQPRPRRLGPLPISC